MPPCDLLVVMVISTACYEFLSDFTRESTGKLSRISLVWLCGVCVLAVSSFREVLCRGISSDSSGKENQRRCRSHECPSSCPFGDFFSYPYLQIQLSSLRKVFTKTTFRWNSVYTTATNNRFHSQAMSLRLNEPGNESLDSVNENTRIRAMFP